MAARSPARCSRCRRRVCRRSLRQRGIGWIEDPSNASPAFERVRLRAAKAALESLGLTPRHAGPERAPTAAGAHRARSLGGRCARSRSGHRRGAPVRFLQHRSPTAWRALPEEIVAAPARSCHRRGRRSRRARAARRAGGDRARACRPTRHRRVDAGARQGRRRARRAPADRARARPRGAAGAVARRRRPWRCGTAASASPSMPGGQARSRYARSVSRDCARCARGSRFPPACPSSRCAPCPRSGAAISLLAVPPLGFWADDHARTQLAATFVGLAMPGSILARDQAWPRPMARGLTPACSSALHSPWGFTLRRRRPCRPLRPAPTWLSNRQRRCHAGGLAVCVCNAYACCGPCSPGCQRLHQLRRTRLRHPAILRGDGPRPAAPASMVGARKKLCSSGSVATS